MLYTLLLLLKKREGCRAVGQKSVQHWLIKTPRILPICPNVEKVLFLLNVQEMYHSLSLSLTTDSKSSKSRLNKGFIQV